MIFGVGIDLVEIARIEAILNRREEKFLRRVFSAGEIRCGKGRARPAVYFAGRFAVKEAFLKAAGTGMGRGIGLRDVETVHDEKGKPLLRVAGGAEAFLKAQGVQRTHLTISDTRVHATALVILER